MDQAEQAERADQRAAGHHDVAAVAVDRAADERRDQAGDQQAEREAAHGERQRPAALGRDQRHGQHRRIEDRAPGDDLRDAEHRHRAPGAVTATSRTRRHCAQYRSRAETARSLRRDLGRRERRHLRGEAVEPGDELGMVGAPVAGKRRSRWPSKQASAIWPTFGIGSSGGGVGFERGEAARDLVGLVVEPLRLVVLRRPEAAFVEHQRICASVMPSASACRRSAAKRAVGLARDDLAAAGAMVEVFEDHARVEQRRAVLQDQRSESCRPDSAGAACRWRRWCRPARF